MNGGLRNSDWWLAGAIALAVVLGIVAYFRSICPPVFC